MFGVEEFVDDLAASSIIGHPRLMREVNRYLDVQNEFSRSEDVSSAPQFQKKFQSFYKVRGRDASWRRAFFGVMQSQRNSTNAFEPLLKELASKLHKVGSRYQCEPSFVSKMAATFDPDLPVLDKNVLTVMRGCWSTSDPPANDWKLLVTGPVDARIDHAIDVYNRLASKCHEILECAAFAHIIHRFDERVGSTPLTRMKKLDIVLWLYGAATKESRSASSPG